ncbi:MULTISPECIES: hypothetical protein [unclassified Sphingomonas]|nr:MULTISPECIES: hypothetical protein [unclassified Sphingomonas]
MPIPITQPWQRHRFWPWLASRHDKQNRAIEGYSRRSICGILVALQDRREQRMLRIIGAALIMLALPSAAQARAPHSCSSASLQGGFGSTLKGVLVAGGAVAAVSYVNFDGKGGFSAVGSSSSNGTLSVDTKVEGKYRLDADCTGHIASQTASTSLIFPSGYFVFASEAGEIRLVTDDRSVIANLTAKRQFKDARRAPCTDADLHGSFISSGEGPIIGSGAFAAAGIIHFDGKGGLSVDRTLNFNGTMLPNKKVNARYKLGPDCHGMLQYASEAEFSPQAATTYDTFVLADDGREVRIFSANPGRVLTVSALKQSD